MNVLVPIQVSDSNSRSADLFDLRTELLFNLAQVDSPRQYPLCLPQSTGRKEPLGIYQARNLSRFDDRWSLSKIEMDTHTELGVTLAHRSS